MVLWGFVLSILNMLWLGAVFFACRCKRRWLQFRRAFTRRQAIGDEENCACNGHNSQTSAYVYPHHLVEKGIYEQDATEPLPYIQPHHAMQNEVYGLDTSEPVQYSQLHHLLHKGIYELEGADPRDLQEHTMHSLLGASDSDETGSELDKNATGVSSQSCRRRRPRGRNTSSISAAAAVSTGIAVSDRVLRSRGKRQERITLEEQGLCPRYMG
jgi:hypothetical protein